MQPIFDLTNSKGDRTGGIHQFFRSLNSEMRNFPDHYPMVCWDNGQAERRLAVYPNYKRNAERSVELAEIQALGLDAEPDVYLMEYGRQRAEVIDMLGHLGIPSFRVKGWEGDDLIYILSKVANDGVVLTDDKDMIQLLTPNVRIARPMAKQLLEYHSYQEENNDPAMRKFVMIKAIVGDGSDNIPKCAKGVGGKTAAFIAETIHDNPDNWKEILGAINKKAMQSFMSEESLRQFDINMELVDLSRVEIDSDIQKIVIDEISSSVCVPNYFKFMASLGKHELTSLDSDTMISNLTSLVNRGEILWQ